MSIFKPNKRLQPISAKWVLIITIITILCTVLIVYATGYQNSRSILDNTLISATFLSIFFFTFLFWALFRGVKIKHDVDGATEELNWSGTSSGGSWLGDMKFPDFPDLGGGDDLDLGGCLVSLALWLLISIAFIILIFLFEAVIWVAIMWMFGMLYWIFFRALKLVLAHAVNCKGNLPLSMAIALRYTVLYTFWIFAIILIVEWIK
ncbi:MAG: hypothetical protein AAFX87_01385 [Bacteroidota bacterium]